VSYHPAHVSRMARSLGLSSQKPAQRANQRDEGAIEDWKENRWPELKKAPLCVKRRPGASSPNRRVAA
jgi:hypothetical protein